MSGNCFFQRLAVLGLAAMIAACAATEETAPVEPPTPPPAPPSGGYPVAVAVPGWEGRVYSPYNGRLVDVEGLPSGGLVADPHFPEEERKYFRLP